MDTQFSVNLSPMDESRFGIVTARAWLQTPGDVALCMEFCRKHRARLLIARCVTENIGVAQALEAVGAHLMDCLVYFSRDLRVRPFNDLAVPPILVEPVRQSDADSVRDIAIHAFKNYRGHYHADANLLRSRADQAYVDWAVRVCRDRDAADMVLVAKVNSDPVGFIALRRDNAMDIEIVLNAVHPRAQGQGIYSALFWHALKWASDNDARKCFISTQIDNIAPQKVWVRNGMEPLKSVYTFHNWCALANFGVVEVLENHERV